MIFWETVAVYWESYKTQKYTVIEDIGELILYISSPYRALNTFHLGYKNQSVYTVSGTSRCLFSDKYKTHKFI